MLELGDAKLELVPFVPGDEAELPQRAMECRTGTLAHPHGIAAPASCCVLDPAANLVAAQPAALRERVGELVRAICSQRNGADDREGETLQGLRVVHFRPDRLEWSFQTAPRAKPARPDGRHRKAAP